MLTAADNELLTRTGADTAMGGLFRRFWVPVLLSQELPEPDCPPVRVKVLGEELVAFRDTQGRVGLLDQRCPHRGANLFFGRNEQGGLRCVFHGWKFNVDGRCLDMPNVEPGPNRDRLCARMQVAAYPVREWGDFVWAYMGPREQMPELPMMEFGLLPPAHRFVSKKFQDCNWAQVCEGALDTAHFSFLHMTVDDAQKEAQATRQRMVKGYESQSMSDDRLRWLRDDGAPRYSVLSHEAGLALGGARKADDGALYWRIAQFLMPSHCYAPGTARGENYHGQTVVPIDDTSCWVYCYTWNPERPLADAERAKFRSGAVIHAEVDRNWVPVRNRGNDYMIDRVEQKHRSFTGVTGISEQDACIQDSQGRIADRTRERLVASDVGVVRFRQLMLQSVRQLADANTLPAGTDPHAYFVRSGSCVAPSGMPLEQVMAERFGDPAGRVTRPESEKRTATN
jgi:phenylpropionate dioxygenase-like ring-hydroxylating dioxygenase large terminal subunit